MLFSVLTLNSFFFFHFNNSPPFSSRHLLAIQFSRALDPKSRVGAPFVCFISVLKRPPQYGGHHSQTQPSFYRDGDGKANNRNPPEYQWSVCMHNTYSTISYNSPSDALEEFGWALASAIQSIRPQRPEADGQAADSHGETQVLEMSMPFYWWMLLHCLVSARKKPTFK